MGSCQGFFLPCRCKVKMSCLCKLEMSSFIGSWRTHGRGANRVEHEGTRTAEDIASSGGRTPEASVSFRSACVSGVAKFKTCAPSPFDGEGSAGSASTLDSGVISVCGSQTSLPARSLLVDPDSPAPQPRSPTRERSLVHRSCPVPLPHGRTSPPPSFSPILRASGNTSSGEVTLRMSR